MEADDILAIKYMAQIFLRTLDLSGNPQNGSFTNNGGYCVWNLNLRRIMGDSFDDSPLVKIQFKSGMNPLSYGLSYYPTIYLTDLPFHNGNWTPKSDVSGGLTNKVPITHTKMLTGYSTTTTEINYGEKIMDGAIINRQESVRLGIQFWNETANSAVVFTSFQPTSYIFTIEPYFPKLAAPLVLKKPFSATLRLRTNSLAAANGSNEFISKTNYGLESIFQVDLALAVGRTMYDKYYKFRIELCSVSSYNVLTSNGYTITVFSLPFCPQNYLGIVFADNGRIGLAHYKKQVGNYNLNSYLSNGINQFQTLPFYIYRQPMLRWGMSMANCNTGGLGTSSNADAQIEYLFNIYGEE